MSQPVVDNSLILWMYNQQRIKMYLYNMFNIKYIPTYIIELNNFGFYYINRQQ